MTTPPLDPGFWKEIKPLRVVSSAVAIRRKPRVCLNFHPATSYWCLSHEGDTPIMQVGFTADLSHDDPEQNVLVIDVYPKGTRAGYPFTDKFCIRPSELVTQRLNLMVVPVVGEEGKNWKGRFVLVDQWKRRYKTEEHEFRWAGPRKDAPKNLSA